jgi:hypothetical protein
MNHRISAALLLIHSIIVFVIYLLLAVSKWFPYGHVLKGIRECLYKFF